MGIPDDDYTAGQSISAFKHYILRNVCYSFQSNAKKNVLYRTNISMLEFMVPSISKTLLV